MDVYEKLQRVQAGLAVPKTRSNGYQGYAYRTCEDIIDAAKPLLAEQGLVLLVSDEPAEIGGRGYVRACALVRDAATGEACEPATASAREGEPNKGQNPAQATRSCASYARKGALEGLFALGETGVPASPQGPGLRELMAEAAELGFSEEAVAKSCRKRFGKEPAEAGPEEVAELMRRMRSAR